MVDPITPAIAGAASHLPAATKIRTVRNILKVLGLWTFPYATRRAIDDLADLESRDAVRKALDKAAAEQLAADPGIVSRYAARLASDAQIKQSNLEEIGRMAIEEIAADDSVSDVSDADEAEKPDIDDGWRLKYTGFAEGVTDRDMQRVWARVLAGEIKNPGAFSVQTMRLLAEMEPRVAEIFEELSHHAFAGNAIFTPNPDAWGQGELYQKVIALQNAGLISERAGQSTRSVNRDERRRHFVWGKNFAGLNYSPGGPDTFHIPIIQLTVPGQQLLSLLPPQNELAVIRSIFLHFAGHGLSTSGSVCFIGHRVQTGEVVRVDALEYLWGSAAERNNIPPAP